MILDKELLSALIAIFGIALYVFLNSHVSENSLPAISNSEALELDSLPLSLPNPEVVEDTCSICRSEVLYSGSFLTRCDHWYHKECLEPQFRLHEELRNEPSCPNCPNRITSNVNEEAKSYVENMKLKPFDSANYKKFMKYIILNPYNFDYEFLMNEISEIQPDFDINYTLEDGNTLYSLAVKNNNTNAVRYFLKNMGKDIDDLSEKEQDDLTIGAIKCGHLEFALFMIERTAVLERGFYAIFFEAVKNDQFIIVKLLIEKGADIKKKEASSNFNAVQLAVFGDKVETLKILLNTGKADLNFLDENGMNLFESSIVKGNSDIVRLIIDHESPDSVSEFVNKFDREGRSPLLLACMNSKTNVDVVKVLIEAGAELDLKCPLGASPIEYVIKKVNRYNELFQVFFDEIKNDRQKLESAIEYAKQSIRFGSYGPLVIALFDLVFREKKLDEVIRISRNEYQEMDIIRHLVDKYAKPIHDISHLSVKQRLNELIISLFEEEKYDLIIDLTLQEIDYSFINLNSAFFTVDLELWFKFFKKILESGRKNEFINSVKKVENAKATSILYYVYLMKNGMPCDHLDPNFLNGTSCYISEMLNRNFDAVLYEKLVVLFESIKNNLPFLGGRTRIKDILDETEPFIKMARFSIDESVLSELEPYYSALLLIKKIRFESREDIAKNFFATMDSVKFNEFLSETLHLFSLASSEKKYYSSTIRFFQLIPEEAKPVVYNSVHFRNFALLYLKISDFSIDTDLTYTFTFQPRSEEQLIWGIIEPIVCRPENSETFEFFCSILTIAVFESSDVFNRYFETLLNYMGQEPFLEQIEYELINHENITFLIESNEHVDLFQRMDIQLKFNAKFIETISIENISERYCEKPIFLVPEDLEFVPNDDIEQWKKIEVFTGKSIYQIMIEYLIPRIENENPSIYLDVRNIFVHLMSGPFIESLKEIKAKNLKKILAIDFPELKIPIEN